MFNKSPLKKEFIYFRSRGPSNSNLLPLRTSGYFSIFRLLFVFLYFSILKTQFLLKNTLNLTFFEGHIRGRLH